MNCLTVAVGNRSTSPEDRSVVRSDYVLYLWIGQKDYMAARDVLTRAVADNEGDILNRINLLQLFRMQGDRNGVLTLLADLQDRHLSRQDRALVQEVKNELVAQGVVSNGL